MATLTQAIEDAVRVRVSAETLKQRSIQVGDGESEVTAVITAAADDAADWITERTGISSGDDKRAVRWGVRQAIWLLNHAYPNNHTDASEAEAERIEKGVELLADGLRQEASTPAVAEADEDEDG